MMRPRLASLVLLVLCGSSALTGLPAVAAQAHGSVDTAARASRSRPLTRTSSIALSPAPDDLALAEISFHPRTRSQAISGRTVRLVATAPYGDDYVAVAASTARTAGSLRVLVLVVNRPSPLEDPLNVHLRLTARRALGAPVVWKLSNPFAQPQSGLTPALCTLPLRGSTQGSAGLLALGSQGAALSGYGVATALAQAYDVACALPYESSFAQDVTASAPAPSPAPPSPVPPTPGPPVCTPCDPAPGYACPDVRPSVCAAPVAAGSRRAPAGAH